MINIRPYKVGDEKQAQELNEIVMRSQGSTSDFFKEDLVDIQTYFLNTGGMFYVAEDEGQIIGTLGLKKIGGDVGYMKRFRVHPDYQGRGIGRRLLEVIIQEMKEHNIPRAFVSSGKKEVVAHHLYESFGAIRKCDVKQGRDYFYELVLDENNNLPTLSINK